MTRFPSSLSESAIVNLLSGGPLRVTDLVAKVSASCSISPEAVYLALRNLKHKRIAVVTKGTASLYVFWMQDMQKFVDSVEQGYGREYTELLLFRDIRNPSFRSKTIECPSFTDLETTFHHVAQSLIQPQKELTPYFFFGFAPWWMTLCPGDADSFVMQLVQNNYQPLMVFAEQFPIDRSTVARLRKLGCQIVFVGKDHVPFGLEGHYVHGIFLQALHAKKEYPPFFEEYSRATPQERERIEQLMRAFPNGKVRVSRTRTPFKKEVLDLFAVPRGIFKT